MKPTTWFYWTSQSYGVVSSVCAPYIVQCTSRQWYNYSHI